MFASSQSRAAAMYQQVGVESAINGASSHQLVGLLYDGVLKSIEKAKTAMHQGDVQRKGEAIMKAIRIFQEGLLAHLDEARGGEVATNLKRLYEYCVVRLTQANLRNEPSMLDEVANILGMVADGWSKMDLAKNTPRPVM